MQGLIHRDLKTGNLLLSGGIVKLGDFGISKLLAAHESAARTMGGRPYYMSPEILQAKRLLPEMLCPHPGLGAQVALAGPSEVEGRMQGKVYGPKTDVWALGCILYELCTRKKAFDAPNLGTITIRIMR